jgi:protocatechuate 3,4-dioxygenase beta subunit
MLLAPGLSLLLLLAPQGVATAAPAGAQISGVVVDADSRAPLRGVRVVLFIEAPLPPPPAMRGPHVLMTDRSGRFTFDRLTAGTFRIDAMKAGYVRSIDPNERPTFSITADQHVDGVTVPLRKGGAIAGRILDRDGEPMTEARVQASPWTPAAIGVSGVSGPSAMTNDLGEFRIFGLAPGDYLLEATPQTAIVCFDCGGFNRPVLISTYYPGTTDRASASRVKVAGGQTTSGIELTLQSGPSFHVSGIVVDPRGRPVEGAWIRLVVDPPGAAGNSPGEVQSDASGRFRLDGVPGGRYRLFAMPPRSADLRVATPAQPRTITVDKEDVSDIKMVVRLSTE